MFRVWFLLFIFPNIHLSLRIYLGSLELEIHLEIHLIFEYLLVLKLSKEMFDHSII